jgi:hypothetical protein
MIRAKPQINGNAREDFEHAYVALTEAMTAIQKAASILRAEITNGRNYQHLGEAGTDAAIEDRRRIDTTMLKASGMLGLIASDIVDVLEDA